MKRVEVAGLAFHPISQQSARMSIAHAIEERRARKNAYIVIKPYVEFFIGAWHDPRLAKRLHAADLVLADGVAVQWAASYLHGKPGFLRLMKSLLIDIQLPQWRDQVIPERGAGVDATHALLQEAEQRSWRIGIIGGPRDTRATEKALRKKYPKLQLIHVWSGYYSSVDEPSLVKQIASRKLDVLFCAMGFPRQENFMFDHRSDRLAKVMIGEGGTFDFDTMGGPLKRAPQWVRKIGLEWFWRLGLQPVRWRRQLAIPQFIAGVYRFSKKS